LSQLLELCLLMSSTVERFDLRIRDHKGVGPSETGRQPGFDDATHQRDFGIEAFREGARMRSGQR
jgi:hypothetical protein